MEEQEAKESKLVSENEELKKTVGEQKEEIARLQDRIEEYIQKEGSPSKQSYTNEQIGYQNYLNAFESRNSEKTQTLRAPCHLTIMEREEHTERIDNAGILEIKLQLDNLTKKISSNDIASSNKLTAENTELKYMISQREQEIREGRKAQKELENKLIERYSKYQFKKDQLKTEQYTKNTLTE